jgi:hypothetical protein
MRIVTLVGMAFVVATASAQLTVVSTSPVNGSAAVGTNTTISITFSEPLDSTLVLQGEYRVFSNISSLGAQQFSPDFQTVSYDVVLDSARAYFFCVYSVRAQSGAVMNTPYCMHFSTGWVFPPWSVGGNLLAGATGVSPAFALVILSSTSLMGSGPTPVAAVVADSDGTFTIPYVTDGVYYPVSAKDVDGDGQINPDAGTDVIAFADSIIVAGGNVTGLEMTFMRLLPLSLHEALPLADTLSQSLPPDRSLRQVQAWGVDTLGRARTWSFAYLANSSTSGYRIEVGSMDRRVDLLDSMWIDWLIRSRPVPDLLGASTSAAFIASVENNGGRAFRTQSVLPPLRFEASVAVGDIRSCGYWGLVPDTSLSYWGARYSWGYDSLNSWIPVLVQEYVGDFATGAVLLVNGVRGKDNGLVPATTRLVQNYPNPFNGETTIGFEIQPARTTVSGEWVTLKVYDVLGREVASLVNEPMQAGTYTVRFNRRDVPSGVYFYSLHAGGTRVTRTMMVLK